MTPTVKHFTKGNTNGDACSAKLKCEAVRLYVIGEKPQNRISMRVSNYFMEMCHVIEVKSAFQRTSKAFYIEILLGFDCDGVSL